MVATLQNTPQFTGGGTVFGRNAAQWNQYFAAKVDAENGTADNITLTGTTTVGGLPLTPVSGVTVPLSLASGTLTLDYNNGFSLDGFGTLQVAAWVSVPQTGSFSCATPSGTAFIDTVTNTITGTLPPTPNKDDIWRFKDSTGHAATHNITINGNGHNIDGGATLVLSTNLAHTFLQFNGTQWNVM